MNKPTFEILTDLVSLLMFIGALGHMMFSTTDILQAFEEVSESSQTVYNVQQRIPKEVLWSGSQVVGKLYRLTEEDVPIVVDGVSFSTDLDVMQNIQTINKNGHYSQALEFNANGELTKITFSTQ